MNLKLKHMIVILNRLVFLSTFILQNFQFVLQYFDSLLQFCQILGWILDKVHIFVPSWLYLFVQSLKMLQFVTCLLVFLGKIKYQKFLNLQLFSGLSNLGSSWGCFSCHWLSSTGGVFDLFLEIIDNLFEVGQVLLEFSDFCLYLFLFILIIGCLYFNGFSFFMHNRSVFFNLLFSALLLPHFRSNNGKFFSNFFYHHLSLLADLYLLGANHFLFLVLPF